jgi:hypothetical protein
VAEIIVEDVQNCCRWRKIGRDRTRSDNMRRDQKNGREGEVYIGLIPKSEGTATLRGAIHRDMSVPFSETALPWMRTRMPLKNG